MSQDIYLELALRFQEVHCKLISIETASTFYLTCLDYTYKIENSAVRNE